MGRTIDRRAVEDGFTLIETLISLALISVLMASLGTYFISTQRVGRNEGQVQAANLLARTGMERARGYGGSTLLYGRAVCGSCANLDAYADGYFDNMQRWDAPVSGVTPTVPTPNNIETIVVDGISYYRYFFVGKCWQAVGAQKCVSPAPAAPYVAMVRLVVGIYWFEAGCPGAFKVCIRAATGLFNAEPDDPVYN